jgi:hypothetical protein
MQANKTASQINTATSTQDTTQSQPRHKRLCSSSLLALALAASQSQPEPASQEARYYRVRASQSSQPRASYSRLLARAKSQPEQPDYCEICTAFIEPLQPRFAVRTTTEQPSLFAGSYVIEPICSDCYANKPEDTHIKIVAKPRHRA